MDTHAQPTRDPATGYASGDVLDQRPNRDADSVHEDLKDPMNGYQSADLLDAPAPPNPRPSSVPHADPEQDSMNGYASADVLDSTPSETPRG